MCSFSLKYAYTKSFSCDFFQVEEPDTCETTFSHLLCICSLFCNNFWQELCVDCTKYFLRNSCFLVLLFLFCQFFTHAKADFWLYVMILNTHPFVKAALSMTCESWVSNSLIFTFGSKLWCLIILFVALVTLAKNTWKMWERVVLVIHLHTDYLATSILVCYIHTSFVLEFTIFIQYFFFVLIQIILQLLFQGHVPFPLMSYQYLSITHSSYTTLSGVNHPFSCKFYTHTSACAHHSL